MNRRLLLLFIALLPLAMTAQTNIRIKKGKFKVATANVVPNWSLNDLYAALGNPERTRDGYNKTHTYDSKSIVLFEPMKDKVPTGKVSEVQVYFSVPEANNVTPNGSGFSGTLQVDNLKITSALTATEMQSKLKKWKKTDSYIEHSYRMACKGLYIYFQFDDSETRLVKVSVGPDKRDKK